MCARRSTAPASIPSARAGQISLERLRRLVPAIHEVLAEAIAAGGSTLRDFASPDGELGYFPKSFAVYDREGSRARCGGSVRRIVQGGRSTFYCPTLPALTLTLARSEGRGPATSARAFGSAPLFHSSYEEDNGEHAAGQKAHPPQRQPRRRSTIRESAGSGPSSRPSSWRSRRARRPMPPRR